MSLSVLWYIYPSIYMWTSHCYFCVQLFFKIILDYVFSIKLFNIITPTRDTLWSHFIKLKQKNNLMKYVLLKKKIHKNYRWYLKTQYNNETKESTHFSTFESTVNCEVRFNYTLLGPCHWQLLCCNNVW